MDGGRKYSMKRFTFKMVAVAALLALSAVLWVGCGGDDKGNPATTEHTHDWGEWTVTTPATCDAAGTETRTCKLDATHKETQSIPKLSGAACQAGGGYDFVELGGLKWMKKNLNVETAESWCYGNSPDSCAKYGRLYTWSAAKAACQSVGMRLPTRADWDALVTAAGGSSTAGSKLKSSTGWNSYSGISSTDQYGFSALPGGSRTSGGGFDGAGNYGYWWTATEYSAGNAYYRFMVYYYDNVDDSPTYESYGRSVRCVKE